jgi:hypothetical protein
MASVLVASQKAMSQTAPPYESTVSAGRRDVRSHSVTAPCRPAEITRPSEVQHTLSAAEGSPPTSRWQQYCPSSAHTSTFPFSRPTAMYPPPLLLLAAAPGSASASAAGARALSDVTPDGIQPTLVQRCASTRRLDVGGAAALSTPSTDAAAPSSPTSAPCDPDFLRFLPMAGSWPSLFCSPLPPHKGVRRHADEDAVCAGRRNAGARARPGKGQCP